MMHAAPIIHTGSQNLKQNTSPAKRLFSYMTKVVDNYPKDHYAFAQQIHQNTVAQSHFLTASEGKIKLFFY